MDSLDKHDLDVAEAMAADPSKGYLKSVDERGYIMETWWEKGEITRNKGTPK